MVCVGMGFVTMFGRGGRGGIDGSGMFDFRKIEMTMERRLSNKVGAANAGWASQVRFRGLRHRPGMADLFR